MPRAAMTLANELQQPLQAQLNLMFDNFSDKYFIFIINQVFEKVYILLTTKRI